MFLSLSNKLQQQKGFTLVELMVVIAIIAILATIAIPKFSSSTDAAKNSKLAADLRTLDGCLSLYYSQRSEYPESLDVLKNGDKTAGKSEVKQLITELPKDAKGNDMNYKKENSGYALKGKDAAGNEQKSPGSN